MILYLTVAIAVLCFPPFYRKAFGLEKGEPRGEDLLRWAQFTLLVLIGLGLGRNPCWSDRLTHGVVAALVLACWCELVLRLMARYLLPALGRLVPTCAKVYEYLTENPDNLYYSRYVPHPFLQFTGPRGPVPGSAGDYFLGFKEIKLSDVPKPPGVIRIACLGGSTTADGYPECLRDYLSAANPSARFQVLNFGGMWWSSVHSTVNYVLNVIDYKPDYVVLHDGCNDHHYRGFPGLRGDCAHAYRLFQVPWTMGESLFRYSLIYRIVRIALSWGIPSVFRRSMEMKQIGLEPGKSYNYVPAELAIVERNFRTIVVLAREQGSVVVLTTTPLSATRRFSEEHDKVYRPHAQRVNEIIRALSRETGSALVDLDASMTGREEYFDDAVHSSSAGKRAKAEKIGRSLLTDLKARNAGAQT